MFSLFSHIGAMIAPNVAVLSQYGASVPFLTFGVIGAVCGNLGFACFFRSSGI
jgi:hypothetical protein